MQDLKKGFDHRWEAVTVIPAESGRDIIVQFADWTVRTINLAHMIDRPDPGVFENLRDRSFFNRVRVLDGVVCWPGDIDLDGEGLYELSH